MPDEVVRALARLPWSAALLYVSLRLLIDPALFLDSLGGLEKGIRSFEHQIRGLPWVPSDHDAAPLPISPIGRISFGIAGVVLSVLAVLYLAGWPAR
jgi:hypothetical protein